jgi:zinc/manganese transport system ATP-binding protein
VTALLFENVAIELGGRTILSNVDFAIEEGEFVGVLGANGAGKTTLMRAVVGLAPLAQGAIIALGAPAGSRNAAIGYMPQNRGPLASLRLTGYDIVAAGMNGARWGPPRLSAADRREIDWALDMVDARAIASRSLNELSGGERQRLLLSQALIGKPRLLLLDEPLISLDPAHQKSVVETVRRLRDEIKLAVLFSAHELNPLIHAIDRVLYLGSGKAVLGAVDEVITGPTLSRLYGAEIDVVRVAGRIFVMSGDFDVERDPHRHEGSEHGHDRAHDLTRERDGGA